MAYIPHGSTRASGLSDCKGSEVMGSHDLGTPGLGMRMKAGYTSFKKAAPVPRNTVWTPDCRSIEADSEALYLGNQKSYHPQKEPSKLQLPCRICEGLT